MLLGTVAVLIALGVALVLSLGGGSSGGTPFAPIAQAAERTAATPGARFSGTGQASAQGFEITMRLSGTYNGHSERSLMRMEAEVPAMPALAEQLNPTIGIQDGLTTFMSSPALVAGLPDGRTWIKVDYSDIVSTQQQAGSTDARAMLDQLRAVGDAGSVGSERVRGKPTTHYAGTIDPELQAEQYRAAGNDLAADLVAEQGGAAAIDVWIDDKDLVRRLSMTVPFELVGGEGSEMSMTMEFYDFGITPEIGLPPEDEVFDATQLSRELLDEALEQP